MLASGPSATPEVIESLRGRNVIIINSTVLSATWAPVWFFCDTAVLLRRDGGRFVPQVSRSGVDMVEFAKSFAGMIVTTSRQVKEALPQVHLLSKDLVSRFPAPGAPPVKHKQSSGQVAISLAVLMGATRIELHGLDMRVVDGREHHHGEYAGMMRDRNIYEQHFLPAFTGWGALAERAGVSIVNATPGSAITEFPMIGE